ncbi:MAG TPA: hypothetical protein VE053_09625 [Allosphingosinicella sp.]|nr:hypothetical protein [Allosphingosinicella sp.]
MKKLLLAASTLLLALQPAAAPAQAVHDYKTMFDILQDGTRPCLFFKLNGVTTADPAVAGEWFAVPRYHLAFAEVFALIVTARTLNLTVRVTTNGATSCGVATVDTIYIRG